MAMLLQVDQQFAQRTLREKGIGSRAVLLVELGDQRLGCGDKTRLMLGKGAQDHPKEGSQGVIGQIVEIHR